MSKNNLKQPPLVKVTYRIWWHLYSLEDVEQSQYIIGDFYNKISEEFPEREMSGRVFSPYNHSNSYINRFTKKTDEKDISIELTNDSMELIYGKKSYDWFKFKSNIRFTTEKIEGILKKLLNPDHLHISLEYINFIELNLENTDIFTYLEENLKLKFNQHFYKANQTPLNCNFSIKYRHNETSRVSIQVESGSVDEKKGLLIKYKVDSGKEKTDANHVIKWADDAHHLCEDIFFNMFEKIISKFS